MGFFDNLLKRTVVEPLKNEIIKSVPKKEEKEFNLTVVPFKMGEAPPRKSTEFIKAYKEWVYANVNAIAENVANIEFELYRLKKNNKVEEVKEHEILELLYRVNNFMSKYDLIFTTICHLLLLGEAAWYLVRKNPKNPKEKPIEIWPLRPDYLTIYPGDLEKNEFINRYEYKVPGKEPINFLPYEILFFKNINPQNPYRGMGVVEAAAVTLDTDEYAARWNRNFFFNSARPDAVLMTDQKLTDETYKRLIDKWYSKFGGTDYAHKIAILESGLKYMNIQTSAKDMDFLEQQKWTRDKIMAMFKNTKIALGIVEDVNRASAEVSEYVHAKNVIKPKMQRLVDTLNEFFVPLFAPDLFLDFVDPVPQFVELKLKEYDLAWNKWMTINEIREREGLEPVVNGDAIYLPLTLSPIGTTESSEKYIKLKVKKSKNKKPKKDFSHYIRALRNRNVRMKKLQAEFDDKLKKLLGELIKKKKENKPIKPKYKDITSRESKEQFWKAAIGVSVNFEKKFRDILRTRIYPVLERETLARLRHNFKAIKSKAYDDYIYDEDYGVELSVSELMPLIKIIVEKQGQEAWRFLGLPGHYNSETDLVHAFLTSNTLKFCKSFNQTLRDGIEKAIKEGIKEGEGFDKIAKRIRDVFDNYEQFQAERLARSEVVRATNFASEDAYRQSGIVEAKQWFTANDEMVCEWCGEMDGKIVGLDESFFEKGDVFVGRDKGELEIDYTDIDYPPLHANCRCIITPVIISEKSQEIKVKKKLEYDEKKVEEVIKNILDEYKEEIIEPQLDKIKNINEKLEEIINEPKVETDQEEIKSSTSAEPENRSSGENNN